MKHADDGQEAVGVHENQLEISVPASPGAIGRWTSDDQFDAYAREHGMAKALEQKRLAEEALTCKCGEQEKADRKAAEEGRPPEKISRYQHGSGCPLLGRRTMKRSTRISPEEQEARLKAAPKRRS